MKHEQREAFRELAVTGKTLGLSWDEMLEASFLIHGHVCGGMQLRFRAGVVALKALGTEREANMAHRVSVAIGPP